ncbi:hypothetical protein CGCF413_v015635 [Colletotrichum fructicola]|nr:hypothetical protein CFRS1_v015672 [Colletotrichum fructicola]KAF5482769.1 hypothetical protein CGCF413_v015635 [Colletotrichum fructicola]
MSSSKGIEAHYSIFSAINHRHRASGRWRVAYTDPASPSPEPQLPPPHQNSKPFSNPDPLADLSSHRVFRS